MAEHKIEGLLVKFDEPWYNGTIITPEAFKSSDGAHVPVSAHDGMIGSAPEDIIGHAELEWRPDGIYYVAHLNDTPKTEEMINRTFYDHWRPALFANEIKKTGDKVKYGRIRGLFFAMTCDAAARVFTVDGKDVPLPETDAAKVNKQLRKVNLKIIDLENKIRNAEGELHDFKDKKIQLEALLNEIQEETRSET